MQDTFYAVFITKFPFFRIAIRTSNAFFCFVYKYFHHAQKKIQPKRTILMKTC